MAAGVLIAVAAVILTAFTEIRLGTLMLQDPVLGLGIAVFGLALVAVIIDFIVELPRRLRGRKPAPGEPVVIVPIAMVWFATQLAVLTAVGLLGVATLIALVRDRQAAASLFQALLIVLFPGALAGMALSSLELLVRLARRAVRRLRVSRERPSGS